MCACVKFVNPRLRTVDCRSGEERLRLVNYIMSDESSYIIQAHTQDLCQYIGEIRNIEI